MRSVFIRGSVLNINSTTHSLIAAHKFIRTISKSTKKNQSEISSLPLIVKEDEKIHSFKKWSYLSGKNDNPMIGITIGQLMEQSAQIKPDQNAFIFTHQNVKLTFQSLLEKADQLAAGLKALGANYQDRVGIWAPNCEEWILAQYATARAGLILVNVNPAYQSMELEYALKKVGVKILIMFDKYRTQDYYQTLHSICPEMNPSVDQIESQRLPDLKHVIIIGPNAQPGTLNFSDVLNLADRKGIAAINDMQNKIQFDDAINIQFTSGTTGSPKGATLSHHNIVNNARFMGFRLNFHIDHPKICLPVPLYHCFGMVMGSLQSVVNHCTIVCPSYTFSGKDTMKAVQSERCNSLYGTPTMFIDYLNVEDFDKYDVSSLNSGVIAGSVCPVELMKRGISDLNMKHFAVSYGMTENSPITFQTNYNDSLKKRISTVGKISDFVEAKIVDDNNNVVPLGESGELLIRGYCVFKGYWDDHEQTAKNMSENWFKTGDIASFDEDEYCSIIGRKKDMIIRGGENIYPAEIENLLYQHPNITDIQVISLIFNQAC